MNTKLKSWFFVPVFLIIFMSIPTQIYALVGQLNYDTGTAPASDDPQALQDCNLKLSAATQTTLDFQQQKNKCQETNSLLNKTMKEAVDQNVAQKKSFLITLIAVSSIACMFFVSTVVLLLKRKKENKIPVALNNIPLPHQP